MSSILINSEYLFTKSLKDSKTTVCLIVYIYYKNKTYSISEPSQESVFFGQTGNVEVDILKAELTKEAMLFIKKELCSQ